MEKPFVAKCSKDQQHKSLLLSEMMSYEQLCSLPSSFYHNFNLYIYGIFSL